MKAPYSAIRITFLMIAGLTFMNSSYIQTQQIMEPPVATKIPHKMTVHGHTRLDNYYWLNDRQNPEVIAYLQAENAYTDVVMKPTEALQDKLYNEMLGRIKQTDISVPYKYNGYYYYTRYEEGKEYPIHCRRFDNMDAPEEVMLDGNAMAEGYSYFQIGNWQVSHDNNLIAYAVDTLSRRIYTIFIKDLNTGEIVEHQIPNTSGNLSWANDNRTLFYTVKDETLRPYKVFKHKLNEMASEDELVYYEPDPAFYTFVFKTKSMEYIMIGVNSTMSSEYRFIKADRPMDDFTVIEPRQSDMLYNVDHYADHFYIRTNLNAINFRLMKTPINETGKHHWSEIISHRKDVLLEDFEVFKNHFALTERKNGLNNIRIISWDKQTDYYIEFDEPAYMTYLSTNLDYDTEKLRYGYMSLTTPNSVFEFDMLQRERILLKQQEVLGGYNSDDYQTERFYVNAHDDVQVPVTIVYRKGMKRDGSHPLVLYGYGAYGISMETYFSSSRISLLDRGFIWAIAHTRGGEELGRQWYEVGKKLKKKNSFYDFIACAEYLVDKQYTSTERMFAMGGSAGGLLVGAVVNMRPDLWRGAISQVPFVDVVTTMLDETIPLTTGEYDEWGNPNEKVYYDYMLSYSPYDNVAVADYPAMLITTGLHDSQVQYWEPAKWVAKLREMKTDKNILLLKTNMDFGHGGASGRFEKLKEIALEYAFMLNELGNDLPLL